jgi:16S rRNA (guanine527-N7)-methyltransferase
VSEFSTELGSAWVESGLAALNPEQAARLESHWNLLSRWNAKMNLTAVRSLRESVRVHYCESLLAARLLGELADGTRLLDLGSGGGFPGVPLAARYPRCEVTLVDSNQRKAAFLRESTRGFDNVRVIAARIEDVEGHWDWILSRAVRAEDVLAALPRLGSAVVLFPSTQDLQRLVERSEFVWSEAISSPWSPGHRVVAGRRD